MESQLFGSPAVSPSPLDCSGFNSKFEVHVVYTNWHGTWAALRAADQWGRCLRARIKLWLPLVVPRRIPITVPAVSLSFMEQRLRDLASSCCEGHEIAIEVRLCRDLKQCLAHVLDPTSTVLVGGNKRWLHTREQRLADFIQSCGLRVLFIPAKENVFARPSSSARLTT